MDHTICIENANDRYLIKIKTFTHNLCSHQYIDFAVFEGVDNILIGVFAPGTIQVHAPYFYIRKEDLELLFNFFGTGANGSKGTLIAIVACLIHTFVVPTVVADKHVFEDVVGKAYRAIWALGRVGAVVTK